MKLVKNLILIAALYKLQCRAAQNIISNLAFFGRGQRIPSIYWNDMNKIRGSIDAKIFFPYSESDSSNNSTTTSTDSDESNNDVSTAEKREEANEGDVTNEENNGEDKVEENKEDDDADSFVDTAKNYPLVLFLPGKKNEEYSKITFNVVNDENTDIDLSNFHKIKSEMKLVPPTAKDLISEGYTCESIGLNCVNLMEFDFEARKDEWLSLVNIKLYLESDGFNKEEDSELSPEELKEYRAYYHYQIENLKSPTDTWSEVTGDIVNTNFKGNRYPYTDFLFRNYGTMPVYIFIGNTVFLKKDPTPMVENGEFQNGFEDWSWHKDASKRAVTYFANQIYKDDPEEKAGFKLETDVAGDAGFYVHVIKGISAPPEGLSFVIRPLYDNQFKLKIDNKKEYVLTDDYFKHRNCKIPTDKESKILLDIRSITYADPKYMLTNDISGFFLMSISNIDDIKEIIRENEGEDAAKEYKDVVYIYGMTLHHTYPGNLTEFTHEKLDPDGPECNLKLETHEDWTADKVNPKLPIIQWPDDVTFDTIFSSKNFFIIDDRNLNDEQEQPTQGSDPNGNSNSNNTSEVPTSKANDTKPGDDDNSSGFTFKPFITLCFIVTVFAFLF